MTDSVKDCPNSISIGPNVKFVGSIYSPGSANIDGEVVGKLEAQELVVGKTGSVSGDVTADRIDVHGQLHKDISSATSVVIHATGLVTGSLLYAELEIARGGSFQGTLLPMDN